MDGLASLVWVGLIMFVPRGARTFDIQRRDEQSNRSWDEGSTGGQ